MNKIEEGEREDELRGRREVTGMVLNGSLEWVNCEEVMSVTFESEVELTDRGRVMGTVVKGTLYWVNCEDRLVLVAFCAE